MSKNKIIVIFFLILVSLLFLLACSANIEPMENKTESKKNVQSYLFPSEKKFYLWSFNVGKYKIEDEAKQKLNQLQILGFESYYYQLKKDAGYVLMAGLFNKKKDAQFFGETLKAKQLLNDNSRKIIPKKIDVIKIENIILAQNNHLYQKAKSVLRKYNQAKVNPSSSRQNYQKTVFGKFIKSFQDPFEAEQEVKSLLKGGWPAAIKKETVDGKVFFRVYLSPPRDAFDLSAEPYILNKAEKRQSRIGGMLIIVDVSGFADNTFLLESEKNRNNSSFCVGFSKIGLRKTLLRKISYRLPSSDYFVSIRELNRPNTKVLDIVPVTLKKIDSFKWDVTTHSKVLYPQSLYDGKYFEEAIQRLKPTAPKASLNLALKAVSGNLSKIVGQKTVIIISDFNQQSDSVEILATISALKKGISDLNIFIVSTETSEEGYFLADNIAKTVNGKNWQACKLLTDDKYYNRFESFLKP